MTDFIAHYLEPDKKPQSVQKHLQEASHAASVFAGKIGLPSMGKLAGLLHDLGKYSKVFQDYIRSAEGKLDPDAGSVDSDKLKGKIDHSSAGAQLIWEAWKDRDPMTKFVAQVIALCAASHHSGLMDCLSPNGEDKFSARMAKTWEETHLNEARSAGDRQILNSIAEALRSFPCVAELKNQLGHLLSDEKSHEVREFYVGLMVRFIFSALIDADRLSAAGSAERVGKYPQWNVLIGKLEKHIAGITRRNWVDDIRSEVSAACREFACRDKGLYQLTVPTGGAKTLSSLRFGLHHAARHQMDRIIYVIPYTSIIDQNAAVARSILAGALPKDSDFVVLEHHSNLTPAKETWQTKLLAQNWDARIIFTTTVQFLDTLFAGSTRDVRRMHNLANAVIIFDEVQTIPIKTVHLFNNAVNFLVKACGSTVVFCTATQPLLQAVDPNKGAARLSDNAEMAPRRDELFKDLQRVNVIDERRLGGWSEGEIAGLICDEARWSGSTLAIVNTKATAKSLYDLCKQKLDDVWHLSTSMCPAHRMKVINEIKERLTPDGPEEKKRMVCISTQLIEAGVDIDFGSVVRYLAGLDSIAQAAGRCNRNGARKSGRLIIVNPSHETLDKLPEIRIGKETAERLLDEYRDNPEAFDCNLLSPKAMQRYYEYYFFNRAKEMVYPVSSREIGHDDSLLSLLSTNSLALEAYKRANKIVPAIPLRQAFSSAGAVFRVIDAPTEGIIVPYSDEGRRIIAELCTSDGVQETKALLRQAQQYSVNLFPEQIRLLKERGAVHETQKGGGIFYLDERYYDNDMGVVLEPKEPMPFLEG